MVPAHHGEVPFRSAAVMKRLFVYWHSLFLAFIHIRHIQCPNAHNRVRCGKCSQNTDIQKRICLLASMRPKSYNIKRSKHRKPRPRPSSDPEKNTLGPMASLLFEDSPVIDVLSAWCWMEPSLTSIRCASCFVLVLKGCMDCVLDCIGSFSLLSFILHWLGTTLKPTRHRRKTHRVLI